MLAELPDASLGTTMRAIREHGLDGAALAGEARPGTSSTSHDGALLTARDGQQSACAAHPLPPPEVGASSRVSAEAAGEPCARTLRRESRPPHGRIVDRGEPPGHHRPAKEVDLFAARGSLAGGMTRHDGHWLRDECVCRVSGALLATGMPGRSLAHDRNHHRDPSRLAAVREADRAACARADRDRRGHDRRRDQDAPARGREEALARADESREPRAGAPPKPRRSSNGLAAGWHYRGCRQQVRVACCAHRALTRSLVRLHEISARAERLERPRRGGAAPLPCYLSHWGGRPRRTDRRKAPGPVRGREPPPHARSPG